MRLAKAADVAPAVLFDHIFGDGTLGATEVAQAPEKTDGAGNGPDEPVAAENAESDEDLPLEDVSGTIRGLAERAAQRQGMTLGQFVASAIASQSLKTIRPVSGASKRAAGDAGDGGDADEATDRFGAVWGNISPSHNKRHRRHRRFL